MAKEKKKKKIPLNKSNLISISCGATFGCVLYVAQIRASQHLLKACRMHSGIPILSSVIGGVVLSAAFAQSTISMAYVANFRHNLAESKIEKNRQLLEIHSDTLLYSTIINLGIYKHGNREQLRAVLPSHVILPGSFSKEFIPLTSVQVTKYKKQILQEIGHKYGCHHCGAKAERYIADHIPCTRYLSEFSNLGRSNSWLRSFFASLFNRDVLSTQIHPQVLFPQCKPCSYKQGGYVRGKQSFMKSLTSKGGIVMHKMRLHRYFMFIFPIYIILDKINVNVTFG